MEDIKIEMEYKNDMDINPFEFLAQILCEKFLTEKKELSEINPIELKKSESTLNHDLIIAN